MTNQQFHEILNKELDEIIHNDRADFPHKDHQQNKGRALLHWFLNFYAQKPLIKNYITDGQGDQSCDIVFSNVNSEKEEIFYIIQSKYIVFKENKKIDKEEFNASISDFNTILSGKLDLDKIKNEKFKTKYNELIQHLEKNGKAKFIFFTLAEHNPDVDATVETFNKKDENITLEIIDIQRLKYDYIERNIKEIKSSNPLEYHYNAEEDEIELEIERTEGNSYDMLRFQGRASAYMVLLKPKTIWELFKKYGFGLFFKNVRNPLHESNYNEKIAETMLQQPGSFWYFNNGISGITKLMPNIGNRAKKIKISGLQIINGAQTTYSIYKAYDSARPIQRKAMDSDGRITLRLIASSDEPFNLDVTRYTNSQNPIDDRDLVANDEIQERLQRESFETDVWYERRRGEFRGNIPAGVEVVSNEIFAEAYLGFYLEKFDIIYHKYYFIKVKNDPNGVYESIFNKNTHFLDMLAAYKICLTNTNIDLFSLKKRNPSMHFSIANQKVGIFKYLLVKYLSEKYPSNEPHLTNYILKNINKNEAFFKKIQARSFAISFQYFRLPYEIIIHHIKNHPDIINFIENPNQPLIPPTSE